LREYNNWAVLYLAQSYSRDPENAFKIACETTTILRKKGFIVFSPILYTHHYHQYMKSTVGESFRGNYTQWDLLLAHRLAFGPLPIGQRGLYLSTLVMVFHENCFTPDVSQFISKGAKKEYQWAQHNGIKCYLLSDVILHAKPFDSFEYHCKSLKIDGGEK
jgi:hypothetical protein